MMNGPVTVQSVVRDARLLLWVNICDCGVREEEKDGIFFLTQRLKTSLVLRSYEIVHGFC